MILSQFRSLLAGHPHKLIRFRLPDGISVPPEYHVTEVGRVTREFIYCGGTSRIATNCLLQAWVAANDQDHRLYSEKLGSIIGLADHLFVDGNIPVEIEYEHPVLSQFSILDHEVSSELITLQLQNKHTDCLAKESCGLEAGTCCGDDNSCGDPAESEASDSTDCCSDNPSSTSSEELESMKPRVLILCTGNSCRSHLAEGILRQAAGDIFEVYSAGSRPAGFVHPKAIGVMAEIGIDISKHVSKNMSDFLQQSIATVITVCGNADQACPMFPGQVNRYHWGFDDLAHAKGSDDEVTAVFRQVRDQIKLVFEAYAAGYREALKRGRIHAS